MGGRFQGTYAADWKEKARGIKERAGWRCVRCEAAHDPQTGYTLTIHHLDGNKSNDAWWNLCPLCQRCHLTIQGKVLMYRPWLYEHSEWFKPYVAGFYAHLHGLPDDEEYVRRNLHALLDLGQQRIERAEYEAVAA